MVKVIGPQAPDVLHQQAIFNLNGVVRYLLKGTEPQYAEKIEITAQDQGAVWFRRATPSMSLGKTARQRDWTEGHVVNDNRTKGLPFPREKRVIDASAA